MLERFEQFTALISSIDRSIQKLERDEMIRCGGKGAYAQYLVLFARQPAGMTLQELCDRSDKDKAAVSRILAEMTEKGMVRPMEPDRIYRQRYGLTELGLQAYRFVEQRAVAAVAGADSGLDMAQRAVFYGTLERIAANLERMTREGIPAESEQDHE